MGIESLDARARARAGAADKEIDPITFSVILHRFNTIAREMTLTLEHTSWTSILALARDFSCAIYDAEARQVCMMRFRRRGPRGRRNRLQRPLQRACPVFYRGESTCSGP